MFFMKMVDSSSELKTVTKFDGAVSSSFSHLNFIGVSPVAMQMTLVLSPSFKWVGNSNDVIFGSAIFESESHLLTAQNQTHMQNRMEMPPE